MVEDEGRYIEDPCVIRTKKIKQTNAGTEHKIQEGSR